MVSLGLQVINYWCSNFSKSKKKKDVRNEVSNVTFSLDYINFFSKTLLQIMYFTEINFFFSILGYKYNVVYWNCSKIKFCQYFPNTICSHRGLLFLFS